MTAHSQVELRVASIANQSRERERQAQWCDNLAISMENTAACGIGVLSYPCDS